MTLVAETAVSQPDLRAVVHDAARRARVAAADLALAPRGVKDAALHAMADALLAATDTLVEANARDLAAGRDAGFTPALLDRLALSGERIAGVADGLRVVAGLPDPVGEVVRGGTLANGLELRQVRVPLGVVGIVYEARPNVTVDAAGLALKSGNAVLLRGSSSARHSNAALVDVLRAALAGTGLPSGRLPVDSGGGLPVDSGGGLPVDSVQLLPSEDRAVVRHLITARGLVDVVLPRGGAGLIDAVVREATVPTIETGVGNCHVYVDAAADLDAALRIVLNAKTRRPSVCNAAESVLVHAGVAAEFLPRLLAALHDAGVTVHGDPAVAALDPAVVAATPQDWDTEYLSLDLAVAVVPGLDAAVEHIARHGSGHTEAIVTADVTAARAFTARVDAAAVMVNASTAFTDGGEFGMGAELGISTQKLHARGPMGLPELTSTKWIVWGDGHVRP